MSAMCAKESQIPFCTLLPSLTPREQKALENSWAKVFAEEIFPAIDEKPFAVLYSDKASRPNTPINVTVGALIIKELFDYTDDEMVENLMFDPRMQYALHTISFEEQPLSDKTLSRFRKRCYDNVKAALTEINAVRNFTSEQLESSYRKHRRNAQRYNAV